MTFISKFKFDYIYGFSFLFGMIGAISIFILVHFLEHPSPKVGTVNVTGMVDQFIKQAAAKKMSQDALKKEVQAFGMKLDSELKIYSEENNLVLMPSEAVIQGAQDFTLEIYQKLQHNSR